MEEALEAFTPDLTQTVVKYKVGTFFKSYVNRFHPYYFDIHPDFIPFYHEVYGPCWTIDPLVSVKSGTARLSETAVDVSDSEINLSVCTFGTIN